MDKAQRPKFASYMHSAVSPAVRSTRPIPRSPRLLAWLAPRIFQFIPASAGSTGAYSRSGQLIDAHQHTREIPDIRNGSPSMRCRDARTSASRLYLDQAKLPFTTFKALTGPRFARKSGRGFGAANGVVTALDTAL